MLRLVRFFDDDQNFRLCEQRYPTVGLQTSVSVVLGCDMESNTEQSRLDPPLSSFLLRRTGASEVSPDRPRRGIRLSGPLKSDESPTADPAPVQPGRNLRDDLNASTRITTRHLRFDSTGVPVPLRSRFRSYATRRRVGPQRKWSGTRALRERFVTNGPSALTSLRLRRVSRGCTPPRCPSRTGLITHSDLVDRVVCERLLWTTRAGCRPGFQSLHSRPTSPREEYRQRGDERVPVSFSGANSEHP